MTGPIDTVFLHVTRACNLRCRYCYYSAAVAAPDEMTRSEYAALWPDLVSVAPAKVVFTGGEPLVRRDVLDLIADLAAADPSHRVLRCLNTNGATMSPALARNLVGLVDEMRLSLDGLRDAHDRHRGHGSFDAAVAALDLLRHEGFEPKVLVTVTAATIDELPGFLCWLSARGLTRIRLNPVRLIGRAAGTPDLAVSAASVMNAVETARVALGLQARDRAAPVGLPRSCGAGHFVNIMHDGDVFPCHVLTDPAFCAGNVRTARLTELVGGGSMLARLRHVDLGDIAEESSEATAALQRLACLGVVRGNRRLRALLTPRAPAPPTPLTPS